jgi:hypothetical protein
MGQIFHGFHQQALAIDIARVGSALAALIAQPGRNCNRKNSSHE